MVQIKNVKLSDMTILNVEEHSFSGLRVFQETKLVENKQKNKSLAISNISNNQHILRCLVNNFIQQNQRKKEVYIWMFQSMHKQVNKQICMNLLLHIYRKYNKINICILKTSLFIYLSTCIIIQSFQRIINQKIQQLILKLNLQNNFNFLKLNKILSEQMRIIYIKSNNKGQQLNKVEHSVYFKIQVNK
ncbi:transmembrane protein, putative (macronuclear) [Tetrahymena thermophila SB210]|uniref:Transmembrane protein, putative n=1 Tax=Tetrahymena thermophila (strain SB210) TaxID=312017 RepID=W7WZU9_TETTS|nr:transmembrane protein, putative [Tetrahymena thermophila SB210]EWS71127.1 transmembrane protein, putative [Tetrahymena thermophila SB210]|eukprot:XP_012656335.1 transmembrane protein, putative [Tetrahymena thermophila SB210]